MPNVVICAALRPPAPGAKPISSAPTPRSRVVQHGKAVPAVLDRAEIQRELGRQRQHRSPVMPRGDAGADQHDRILGALQHIREGMLAGGELASESVPAPR